MKPFISILILAFLVSGCGDPIGHECELRTGALGFGFKDDCNTKCLQLHKVICPNEEVMQKAVCAGAEGCDPGSCGSGEVCYSFNDPFDKIFYCIPADYCGVELSDQEARQWEDTARARSDALRAEFRERMERRKANPSPTLPAEPVPEPTKPVSEIKEPPGPAIVKEAQPVASGTNVLIESWGFDMAPVMCVGDGVLKTGAECVQYLPAGMIVDHGGSQVRSTGRKQLDCAAQGPVTGVGGELLGQGLASQNHWGWVPTAPKQFRTTALEPLDPALLAVAKTVIPNVTPSMTFELAATADFDGNGAQERIVRVFTPSDDPDKPGHTALWVINEASIYQLPSEGLELNGVQDVHGVLELENGGALLVFTSNWTGGSATHVVGAKNGRLAAFAQVACGS